MALDRQLKLAQAYQALGQGDSTQAQKLAGELLADAPNDSSGHELSAFIATRAQRYGEAETHFLKVLALSPDRPEVLFDFARVLNLMGRHDDALMRLDQSLAARPQFSKALHLRIWLLIRLNRLADALSAIEQRLLAEPDNIILLNQRGEVLRGLGQPGSALASFDRAIALLPAHRQSIGNRADAYMELARYAEAVADYDRVIAFDPKIAAPHYNRGLALQNLGRTQAAIDGYRAALEIQPTLRPALNNLAALLKAVQPRQALAILNQLVAADPNDVSALYNRALIFSTLAQYEDALAGFQRVIAIDPDYEDAAAQLLHMRLYCCDWNGLGDAIAEVRDDVAHGRALMGPFESVLLTDSPAFQQDCAIRFSARHYRAGDSSWLPPQQRRDRIRIAYVAGDFYRHAIGNLTLELFQLHDRTRFEIIGISFGPDDKSSVRIRLQEAFDTFIDVRGVGDSEVVALLREKDIDIAVDLTGFTRNQRLGIFNQRIAPIQVNYLGFPGTMGAPFMDYILADRHVIPKDQARFYTEKVAVLPNCYQVNDRQRHRDVAVTRAEMGLPKEGVVFGAFNGCQKFTPEAFDIWMRLLRDVDGSVLWLLDERPVVVNNLKAEARRRGVDDARLVFAPRVSQKEHLTRFGLVDLFLDSYPYTGHTTASEALWTGVPVVTRAGDSFASRVASSILSTAGLPDLVTTSPEAYEALALRIARSPELLRELKARVAVARDASPLFDTPRFTADIETAYRHMWERWARGEAPESFAV